jgi:hypothetical protein
MAATRMTMAGSLAGRATWEKVTRLQQLTIRDDVG